MFNKIFWGFIFLFDFRIQGVDILPDIIGYIMIYSALNYLVSESDYFYQARRFALPLAIISIADIYEFKIDTGMFDPLYVVLFISSIVATVLSLMMIYNICYGIAEMARNKEEHSLEKMAIKRWEIYLYITMGVFIFTVIGSVMPQVLVLLFLPIFIGAIVKMIILLELFKKANRCLEEKDILRS